MNDEYRVIEEFECRGKQMITVRIGNVAHVMSLAEWKLIYGRNHQNRWKNEVDWNKYDYSDGHRKEMVS